MCLVSPARVIAIVGPTATLEVDGRRRAASILLEPEVVVGDWVIVAGGAVLRRIAATDADAMRAAIDHLTPASDAVGPLTGAPR